MILRILLPLLYHVVCPAPGAQPLLTLSIFFVSYSALTEQLPDCDIPQTTLPDRPRAAPRLNFLRSLDQMILFGEAILRMEFESS
jgi:hypothetical protein